jgi:S1-C subfamily serine protease
VAEEEGFDDDGPEFRPPLPPEDRVWRHPAEMRSNPPAAAHVHGGAGTGGLSSAGTIAGASDGPGRSPWTVGFVSVIGGVLLASSLMFGAGGLGEEPGRIALRPVATLAPDDDTTLEISTAGRRSSSSSASTVGIDVRAGDAVRSGHGIAVRSDGFVVTTAAMVLGADDIRVVDDDGTSHLATLVGVDALDDLAVLHVDHTFAAVTDLASGTTTATGDELRLVGGRRGVVAPSWSSAVISTKARLSSGPCDLHNAVQVAATLDTSAAGALALDTENRPIGLATTRVADQPTVVVPVRTVRSVADKIIANGHAQHGWLGVEGTNAAVDTSPSGGALIERVVDASPASLGGLQPADVVVSFDGEPVATMGDLVVAVRERAPGAVVSVDVMRNGTPTDVLVELVEAPAL